MKPIRLPAKEGKKRSKEKEKDKGAREVKKILIRDTNERLFVTPTGETEGGGTGRVDDDRCRLGSKRAKGTKRKREKREIGEVTPIVDQLKACNP